MRNDKSIGYVPFDEFAPFYFPPKHDIVIFSIRNSEHVNLGSIYYYYYACDACADVSWIIDSVFNLIAKERETEKMVE